MLEELIEAYEDALARSDAKKMYEVERMLAHVGMDRASLLTIVRERRKERGCDA